MRNMEFQVRRQCVLFILLILVTTLNLVALYYLVTSFLVIAPIEEVGTFCDVVPIKKWGGAPTHHVEDLPKPVSLVVVTHTVVGECNTDYECEKTANEIRELHKEWGMNDIGLSFLVGENGKVYEGAGWMVGGHTLGYNNKSISLSFIGDFNERIPAPPAVWVAKNFLGCLLNSRYLTCDYLVVGHRQLRPTISPGDALQNLIETWPHWSTYV